ncbi:adenylate/guanylate cyclase domain-containing protein [Aestuariivirga litoralis]|uniref:Adenylate/guanylate cyclase domain-containing protein n=1 Tax=Aestuariivirga litoralis TaxID=2650924 RepID=A0A2W2B4T2_9HYPH|nr:adenylate/guanylate cyclase domain-containing protein [Aestuariivirga litoralis]PZF75088.1 adenylate/guanylate cyclase domain-containing protein [Aestuariivirga litoralis]
MPQERVRRRLAAIMAAEVVGFSRLMEANEEATLEALRQHRQELVEPAVSRHDGRIFKLMGDGFLAEFASAVEATEAALEIQRGLAQRSAALPEDRAIRVRIGINLGDVMVQGDDFYGDDVNLAARMVAHAPPGGIACSAGIRFQIGARLEVSFEDLGEKTLRNIARPLHIFLIGAEQPRNRERAAGRPAPQRTSLAVLPFSNMSGDPQQEYFSDGITEDLITDLSNVSELFVLSRNTVFKHKGRPANMEEIAGDLGVGYLLHGSVRKAGSKVRITAQLTEGASGGQVWADRYDRDLTDIFALQDEITKSIVAQLKVRLLPQERKAIEQAPTRNVEAYTYFLRGRDYFHRGSRTYYNLAKRMFVRAIELDPSYARAYAGLADCDAFLYMDYSEETSEAVLANSGKALSLEPGLADAHASRGLALSIAHRYPESEVEFAAALQLEPDLFEVHYFLGRSCYAQGKLEDTARHWERAAEVKPEDYQTLILLNQVYTSLGREADAVRCATRGVERAEREFAKNPENPRPAYFMATALAKLKDSKRAEQWAKTALAIAPDDYLTLYNIACYYSVGGRPDEAFSVLSRLLPISNADMREWILRDSDFDSLHEDARWQEIRRAAAPDMGGGHA